MEERVLELDRVRLILAALAIVAAAGLIVPHLFPRAAGPAGSFEDNVTLVVSRDFGSIVLGWWEMRPGRTVMEMLRNVTEVETRYGGMFLYEMFGLRSSISNRTDWLYYVNGVFMDVGLSSYVPRPGEVVQVDYHRWGSYSGSPGFLSGYPAIATVGLRGRKRNTTIAASRCLLKLADRLARRLESAGAPTPTVVDQDCVHPQSLRGNLIVLSTEDDASLSEQVFGWEKNVLYPSFLREGQIWLNGVTTSGEALVEGGTVQCVYFPARDLWVMIILGTDEKWVKRALDEVGAERTRFVAAFAVSPSGIIELPLE